MEGGQHMKLNSYFRRSEFACKCGCGKDTVDYTLLNILTELRFFFGRPLHVNSGNRCEVHNASVGGACSGTGIPPTKINIIIGICKAYTTRVGNGPFPTELFDEDGNKLREVGKEFGATTGRPRRCGWLDLVSLQYSNVINGFTHLVITKLDVLNDFKTIKACVKYEINGKTTNYMPTNVDELESVTPIYKSFSGWGSIDNKLLAEEGYEGLPENAKKYLSFIEDFVKVPITLISYGPDRTENVKKSPIF